MRPKQAEYPKAKAGKRETDWRSKERVSGGGGRGALPREEGGWEREEGEDREGERWEMERGELKGENGRKGRRGGKAQEMGCGKEGRLQARTLRGGS